MTHSVHWKKWNKKVLVDPVAASTGDYISWKNADSKPIVLFFPDSRLFGGHQYIVPAHKTRRLRVRFRTNMYTVFPYAIYFVQHGCFGEGSAPIIIVKPGGG